MDEEPRVSRSTWTWVALLVVICWLLAWLLSSCSGNMVDDARMACLRLGGKFAARSGVATAPDGQEHPAVMMLCVIPGKTA